MSTSLAQATARTYLGFEFGVEFRVWEFTAAGPNSETVMEPPAIAHFSIFNAMIIALFGTVPLAVSLRMSIHACAAI